MRRPVDRERLGRFMRALGREVGEDVRVYLTGGATARLTSMNLSNKAILDSNAPVHRLLCTVTDQSNED